MAGVVGHGKPLPVDYTQRIPAGDVQILEFLLSFLADEGLSSVPVFVNGGYVRDLLLGKEPDDLDLSLCLRDCPEEVTVSGLLEKIPAYAVGRPDLGIAEVKIATILSNESKDKQLDTFKAHFVDTRGVKTEVDVMPTIGEEKYGDDNRIPIRDQRGSPEADALRRDLTIGALLLRVERRPTSESSSGLCYDLLDFYGGVDDIRAGVLRSPCPSSSGAAAEVLVAEVRAAVLRSPAEVEMAEKLGLDARSPEEVVQVLWWAKVLMDDPLRICRALRFAAKFRFQLHEAFWSAVPFALEPLRSKVAGSRKNTEYQKIGSYGFKASVEFYELAFTKTFPPGELRLAAALLGGKDFKDKPRYVSAVSGFDLEGFRSLAQEFQPPEEVGSDAAELIGGLMAAAITAAEFEKSDGAVAEFTLACDGMSVSNATREAGYSTLNAALAFAAEPSSVPNGLDHAVAGACGISVEELGLHVQTWEALNALQPRSGPASAGPQRRRMALAMLRRAGPAQRFAQVAESAEALAFLRPPVKGSVLSAEGVMEVPIPMKRQVMVLLEVGLRLIRYDGPVECAGTLVKLFEAFPAFRSAFSSAVWMEADGITLKEEFQPAKRAGGAKAAKKQKASN